VSGLLSRRGAHVVFICMMALAMSLVMSGAMTAVNTGVGGAFMSRWMRAFAVALFVATPTALLISGPLRRAADSLAK